MFTKTKRKQYEIINEVQGSRENLKLVAGVDAGSTGTRVALIDADDYNALQADELNKEAIMNFSHSMTIPSTFAVLDDERELLPKSEALVDNYDSHITLVRCTATEPYIRRVRVIRAQKIKDAAGAVPRFMDSSTPKTKNYVFYVNVIDALGYAILRKYSGDIPKSVDIVLGVSVRPNELGSIYQKILMSNLRGTYTFLWKNIKFDITISAVFATTEPEAQIEGSTSLYELQSMLMEEEAIAENDTAVLEKSVKYKELAHMLLEPSSYIHIEGGGSSIGVEVVKANEDGDMTVMSACSRAFNIGGNFLMRTAKDQIRETYGRTASDESTEAALKTGLLKNGRNMDDVIGVIKTTKKKVAEAIFEKFTHEVIDVNADLVLSDIDFIAMAGELFSEGECGVSIVDYFAELVKTVSPNTIVIRLPENFIPQGNALRILTQHDIFGA